MPVPIILDSTQRDSVSSVSASDCVIRLRAINQLRSIKFKKFVCKYSWYPFTTSSSFTITESVAGATSITMAFPASWSAVDIATMLTTQINTLSPSGNTYAVTYNSVQFKYTIARTAGAETFSLTFPTTNNLWKVLGFSTGTTSAGLTTITSPNVTYSLGPDYFIIQSNELLSGSNQLVRGYQGSATFGLDSEITNNVNVFLNIPINVGIGSTIIYTEMDIERRIDYTRNGKANKFLDLVDIRLIDPYLGTALAINGANWMLELEAEEDQ